MSVILELAIFPTDKGESVSEHVARAVRIIKESGLSYQFGPMGTCIEGEWDEVMAVVRECFVGMSENCDRIYSTMKVDWRRGREDGLNTKVQSVRKRLDEE